MTNRREASENGDDIRDELARLIDQLCVLTDVLERIREELQWLTRNGLPVQEERVPMSPVLKRMALDPIAADWNERLEIVRGGESERGEGSEAAPSPVAPQPAPEQPVSKPGGHSRLF